MQGLRQLAARAGRRPQDARYGPNPHDRAPDRCCGLRTVALPAEGLKAYDARATGLRRDQSPPRAHTPVAARDARRQKVKAAPIARWTQEAVVASVAGHGVLTDPPLPKGCPWIGCASRTRRVREGAHACAGHRAGPGKTERGPHS